MDMIKTRFWLPLSEYMLYSKNQDREAEYFISFDLFENKFCVAFFDPAIAKIEGGEIVETEGWVPEPSIQMLWTGKLDRNNNEIYAGDLVRTPAGRLCKVVWFDSPEFCGWDLNAINSAGYPPHGWSDLKVVGNVYENPELIVEGA